MREFEITLKGIFKKIEIVKALNYIEVGTFINFYDHINIPGILTGSNEFLVASFRVKDVKKIKVIDV